jgi:hypothetical protein
MKAEAEAAYLTMPEVINRKGVSIMLRNGIGKGWSLAGLSG